MAMQYGGDEWRRYLDVALNHGATFATALASGRLVGVDNVEREADYHQIMESVGNWNLAGLQEVGGLQPGGDEWERYFAVASDHGGTFETALASGILVGENDAEKEEDYAHIMEWVGNFMEWVGN